MPLLASSTSKMPHHSKRKTLRCPTLMKFASLQWFLCIKENKQWTVFICTPNREDTSGPPDRSVLAAVLKCRTESRRRSLLSASINRVLVKVGLVESCSAAVMCDWICVKSNNIRLFVLASCCCMDTGSRGGSESHYPFKLLTTVLLRIRSLQICITAFHESNSGSYMAAILGLSRGCRFCQTWTEIQLNLRPLWSSLVTSGLRTSLSLNYFQNK